MPKNLKSNDGGGRGNSPRLHFTVIEITTLGVWAGLMLAVQYALSWVAQIELVCFMTVLCALLFGWKSLFAVLAFCTVRMAVYGTDINALVYFYTFPLLAAAAQPIRKFTAEKRYRPQAMTVLSAALCGLWGLLMGVLFLPSGLVMLSGIQSNKGLSERLFAWWMSGFTYSDLPHGAANAATAALLAVPLYSALSNFIKSSRRLAEQKYKKGI